MCKFPRGEESLTGSLGDENLALPRNKAYQCTQNDLKGVIKNPLLFWHVYSTYRMLVQLLLISGTVEGCFNIFGFLLKRKEPHNTFICTAKTNLLKLNIFFSKFLEIEQKKKRR